MSLLGMPENFQSSDNTSYTIMFIDAGPWVDEDGRNCELVSVDGFGETRWETNPDTTADNDREAVAHFNLSPFKESGKIQRRGGSVDRRRSGAGDRRGGDVRRSGGGERR